MFRILRLVAGAPHAARRFLSQSLVWTLLSLSLILCLSLPARAEVSVRASISPQRGQVGEPLTLSIEVSGARNVAAPSLTIDGFDVRYLGPSTQISIVNLTVNSSVQHRYSLQPLREGHFTLGPFAVDYEGKSYRTASVSVDVLGSGQPQAQAPPAQAPQGQAPPAGHGGAAPPRASAPRTLRLDVSVPQPEVYLHQRLPLDVTLYVGAVRVADVQYPVLTADGLSVEKFPEPSRRQQVIDGETYQVLHFQSTVVPLRTGTLTIGPASMHMNVLSRRRGAFGDDPFFQQFLQGDPFAERRPVDIRSDPVTLNVSPLPEEEKPAGFSGAVGTFTLQVSAGPTDVTAGDPVTLRMELHGNGNLAEASAPELSNADGFRTYDTRAAKPADGSPAGTAAAKSFEQVLIPNDASVSAIPPVRFSYFDPEERRYHTVQSQPIALVVRPPRNAPRAEVFAGGVAAPQRKPEEKLGRDIVYIKDDPGRLSARAVSWYGSLAFLLWQPVPLLLFGVAVWYDRRRQRLSGDRRYARFSRARKQARHGLALAEKALSNGTPAAFYDAASRSMQEYLGAKLDLPPGGIDAEAVASRGVPEDCVQRIVEFFATCEQVRFAPGASKGDMHGALSLARDIIRRLERQRGLAPASAPVTAPRREGESRTAALLLLLSLLVFSVAGAWPTLAAESAPPSPQTTFYHANALYKDGQYTAAAAEYELLLQAGLVSGNVYFNLGNAYVKAGQRGHAILNYERARRLIPEDPDVAANLAYAQSLTGAETCGPAVWQAVLFPLAHRLATQPLLWAASTLYTLLLVALATYRLWPSRPRWLLYLATMLGLLALLTTGSLAQRLLTIEWRRQVVVIRSGETPARFEPAANGTVHFVLKEGSLVRVVDTRQDWLEIARCDGRRGWIEEQAVAER